MLVFVRKIAVLAIITAIAAMTGGVLVPERSAAFPEIAISAPYAILMDAETGSVLFEKNAETLMTPASMTKVVALSVLFDHIKQGVVRLDDEFEVTVNAWRKGGAASGSSTMFLEPQSRASVEDLIRGVVVASGNDAAIAIAEGVAGSEENFARMMTEHARSLGLERSSFINATGWPEPGHQTSVYDLAQITRHQIRTAPDLYRYYAERSFSWNGIAQRNRNALLTQGIGVDGLKTGHTSSSGYGIVASAEQRGRRLILVINGLESERERLREARRLLTWGFRAFRTYYFIRAGDIVDNLVVWHGERGSVSATVSEDVALTLTTEGRRDITVNITYEAPVPAPIVEGDEIGTLQVLDQRGRVIHEAPLLAKHSVSRSGFFGRAAGTLEYMLFGS